MHSVILPGSLQGQLEYSFSLKMLRRAELWKHFILFNILLSGFGMKDVFPKPQCDLKVSRGHLKISILTLLSFFHIQNIYSAFQVTHTYICQEEMKSFANISLRPKSTFFSAEIGQNMMP